MEFYDEKIKALAIEIYELDAEVYIRLILRKKRENCRYTRENSCFPGIILLC